MSGMFRYEELRSFFEKVSSLYRIWNFRDWGGENGVLLRHDVDFDLRAAHRMAKLENSAGVTSTFFIMTTSGFYNTMYNENRQIVREIAGLGFDIGLHYDPTVYGVDGDRVENVRREVSLLESVCDLEVKSVSLHNPSVHGKYPLFEGFRNAYDPSLFSNETYASDSCMDFRGKDLATFISRADHGPVQLLLHPMHYSEEGDDYPAIMERYILEIAEKIDRDFSVNWKFKAQMTGRRVADLLSSR